MSFRKLPARPCHHAQNEFAVEVFKKDFVAEIDAIREPLEPGINIELWFQNEARIGQKNKDYALLGQRGTQPSVPHDQRIKWACILAQSVRKGQSHRPHPALVQYRGYERSSGGDRCCRRPVLMLF